MHLRGKVITAQVAIPKAGSKWHSDLFIKVGGFVYHLGDCRIAAPLSLYSMKSNSSEAERSAYAKLAGITIAEIEAVAKKERDAAKSRNEARALDSLKAQAEAKGYSLVKKRAAKTAKA